MRGEKGKKREERRERKKSGFNIMGGGVDLWRFKQRCGSKSNGEAGRGEEERIE